MNTFLLEAIDNVNRYRQAFEEFFNKVEAIRNEFGTSSVGNYPTFPWLAGKFKQLYNIPQIESSLNSGTIENPEKIEEYKKIIALKDISLKYGFIKKDDNNYKMTDSGSNFVKFLSSNFEKLKDLQKRFREDSFNENEEWYSSLPENEKKIVDIYKNLSAEDYAYFIGLVEKQKNKENYMNYIRSSQDKNSDRIHRLQNLGFINGDLTLNKSNISNFLNFLNEKTYGRMKGFNKNIAYIVDRISADKALVKNALERNIDRSSNRRTKTAVKSDEIIDKLSDNQKEWLKSKYKNSSLKVGLPSEDINLLQSLDLIDNTGTLTEFGTYISIVLTKLERNASLEKSGEKGTQFSRLRKSEVDGNFNASERKNERAGSRSSSFRNFLKQR